MGEHSKIPSPQVLGTVARYPGDMLSSGWKQKGQLWSCSNRHLKPLEDSSNLVTQSEGLLFWGEGVVYLSFSNQGSKEAHECRSWPLLPLLLEKVLVLPFFHTSVWVSTREVRLCSQARLHQTGEQEGCRSPWKPECLAGQELPLGQDWPSDRQKSPWHTGFGSWLFRFFNVTLFFWKQSKGPG